MESDDGSTMTDPEPGRRVEEGAARARRASTACPWKQEVRAILRDATAGASCRRSARTHRHGRRARSPAQPQARCFRCRDARLRKLRRRQDAAMTLSGKRILLIIGGGIAAYKSLDLIRRLRERGASVRCVMTAAAQEFVTPLSVGALTADHVFTELFDRAGRARCRPYPPVARGRPDRRRARHRRPDGQARQRPRQRSRLDRAAGHRQAGADGAGDEPENVGASGDAPQPRDAGRRTASQFVGPDSGEMAESGEAGEGRMAEPLEIVAAIEALLDDRAEAARRAERSSSPPARRMSRSTRCATSPTARRASRAMRSPRRWRGSAPMCASSPARSRSPIRPA